MKNSHKIWIIAHYCPKNTFIRIFVPWESNPLPLIALSAPELKEIQSTLVLRGNIQNHHQDGTSKKMIEKASDIPFRRLRMFSPHPISILSYYWSQYRGWWLNFWGIDPAFCSCQRWNQLCCLTKDALTISPVGRTVSVWMAVCLE